jgi:hypothetical protein
VSDGQANTRAGWRGWVARTGPATILFAGASLLSGTLLIHWMTRQIFWRDEWDFLLHRRGWSLDTFFHPFVEQLLAIPILIYRVLQTTFGMDSALPYQLVAVVLFVLSVVVLFIYARHRMGEWLALAVALPILFLGPSWDDLLFPFQMALFGSVAFGIAALLALDRRDRNGDIVAMILLIICLFFFDLGVPFVAGATVELAFGRDRFRRAYVVVVPTVLWLLWYAGWGHAAETFISFHNFAYSPSYIADGLASSISTLVGLGSTNFSAPRSPLEWGRPLLVLAGVAAGWRLLRLGRIPDRLAAVLTVLLGFWFLSALNTNPLAPASVGRYQYIGAILLVLVIAELLRGVVVGRVAAAIVVFVGATAALANAPELRDASNGIAAMATQEKGGLAALELARGVVDPNLVLNEQNSDVNYLLLVNAGEYLSAVDAYGSPAYTPQELTGAPEPARVAADKVSGAALRIGLTPAPGGLTGPCVTRHLRGRPITAPEGVVMRAKAPGIQLSLRRYATESFPLALGALPPGKAEEVRYLRDDSGRFWTIQLTGTGAVDICDRRPG